MFTDTINLFYYVVIIFTPYIHVQQKLAYFSEMLFRTVHTELVFADHSFINFKDILIINVKDIVFITSQYFCYDQLYFTFIVSFIVMYCPYNVWSLAFKPCRIYVNIWIMKYIPIYELKIIITKQISGP